MPKEKSTEVTPVEKHIEPAKNIPEPVRGFTNIIEKFGYVSYSGYSNIQRRSLVTADIVEAVDKFKTQYKTLPTRAILNTRNENLLPYLHTLVPNIECGLADSTALWEVRLQIP